MANDIVSRTTAAQNQISRWIEAARQRDNALWKMRRIYVRRWPTGTR